MKTTFLENMQQKEIGTFPYLFCLPSYNLSIEPTKTMLFAFDNVKAKVWIDFWKLFMELLSHFRLNKALLEM